MCSEGFSKIDKGILLFEKTEMFFYLRKEMARCLSPSESDTLSLKFLEGKSDREIAKDRGISASKVRSIRLKALTRLKAHLKEVGLSDFF